MTPRRFTGHPISLDFQGVDLRAVLRTFAEITGLNLVIDPEVKGVVDVSLHEVPWDHALDIILRANQLDYTVEGTIVRIAPIETLRTEGESRRKLAEEQALSGELVTVTKTLSYAKAADVAPLLLRTALTKRSSIQVDPRTNNLIITDLQAGIDRADGAARRPRRAAAAGRDRSAHRAHDQGLRQGARHPVGLRRPRPRPSWATRRRSPSRTRSGPTARPARSTSRAPTSARSRLGALNGAFSIDAALSALETEGKVQVLLKPRVVTQNNIKATITRGEEIPYTTLTAVPQRRRRRHDHPAGAAGVVQDRGAHAGGAAADLGLGHGHPRSRRRQRVARHGAGQRQHLGQHAARPDDGAREGPGHDRHRRHLRDARDAQPGSDARPVAGAVHRQLLQAQHDQPRTKANCSSSSRRASSRTPRRSRPQTNPVNGAGK